MGLNNKITILIVCVSQLVIWSCSNDMLKFSSLDQCKISLEETCNTLLGKPVSEIRYLQLYVDCFTIKDSIIDSEEGLKWRALAFYNRGQLVFVAETNWQDTNRISRITVENAFLKSELGFGVASSYSDIQTIIDSEDLNSMPDGYLGLKDKRGLNLIYLMDISDNMDLGIGVENVEAIPDDLKIESIIAIATTSSATQN